jgi:DNA topoisomerase III
LRLYIAEKPSMGAEIAKCLTGPLTRRDGYLETKDGIVTWGFGHILRQAEPNEYDARYKAWRDEDLPIVPQQWKLLVDEKCIKQFNIVKGLIAHADEIVHAGDPDREGQLLIDEVLDYVGNTKPVRRILLNALDEKSIKKANANLRDNHEFFNLKQSALARARADWLIGMNLSRAYTLAARRAGHDITLPVGRVKTPTLALVVRREREIENFKPVDYYTIKAEFTHTNGQFWASWKPQEEQAGLDSEGRLLDAAVAGAKLAEFAEQPRDGIISSYQKLQKKEPQRLPFSLSSLQVLAGRRFGYDPQLVLDTAQKLYERKLTTYPRSDCEYLPVNQLSDAKQILGNLSAGDDTALAGWARGADMSMKSRAWNDKKISAHHAIIPTTVRIKLNTLSGTERNLYFLIAQAYIAQFYPLFLYDQTRVQITYKDELFTASGRVVRDLGWKLLYTANSGKNDKEENKEDSKEDDAEENEDVSALPLMKKKDAVLYEDGQLDKKVTKPSVRFTPATLLAGMKEIHKYVKDPEAKKKLKDVYGIGTEATRATIIDDLIKRSFLKPEGKKKYLVPTPAAYLLVDALPDEMIYPDSTAIWEDQLHSMAEGEGTLEAFLQSQIAFTRLLCTKAIGVHMEVKGEFPCPRCKRGAMVRRHGKNGDFWGCSNYPHCRMSCDDKDGKPDFSAAGTAAENIRTAGSVRKAPAPADSYAAMSPYMSEAEMAAFSEQFQPMVSAQALIAQRGGGQAQAGNGRFDDKTRHSASPLEHMEVQPVNKETGYLCPRCREGALRRIEGKNGAFWGCVNYPRCTATFDDDKGKPVLDG